ncbi:tryptophan-rich sensory protein [Salimicrobium humidisoli]|uniref:Tryptophan-rich sensory protein n=1 Tax=Salimicrobium humidisoli TaxID=2029857 RepID=A0ABX4HR68_9BACI|nr:tryptophan-rich sensory protein [Salimicrobium humidisoli]PBB05712.1 tryptophan-rich sensory protein [Salimicrobium humidisoli]
MPKQRIWAIAYPIAFGLMIFLNYWSATNVGIVADNNQAIIQPAGFAFSIWGLIYILLFIWIIKRFFDNTWVGSLASRLTFWPIVNFLLNGLWIVVFTQQLLVVSTLVIAAILTTLVFIHTSITKGDYNWFDRLPFSIYFAWVTVATIVNVFAVTASLEVETILGLGELDWTLIMLAAATLIGSIVAFRYSDWLYPLVILWPFYGIYVVNENEYSSLNITLLITSIVLVIVALITVVKKFRTKQTA